MHAFARLFTTDLTVNDCREFDWLGTLIKNDEKHLVFDSYANDVNNVYFYPLYVHFPDTQTPILENNGVHTVRPITESIQLIHS